MNKGEQLTNAIMYLIDTLINESENTRFYDICILSLFGVCLLPCTYVLLLSLYSRHDHRPQLN